MTYRLSASDHRYLTYLGDHEPLSQLHHHCPLAAVKRFERHGFAKPIGRESGPFGLLQYGLTDKGRELLASAKVEA